MINQTHDFQCILKAISSSQSQLQTTDGPASLGVRNLNMAQEDAARALAHLLTKKGYQ
ncbi:hypothetical protein [Bacillus sp. 1P06AnD]|uniref:hypothetical protein n=1 Tax=Bacillus sp. 1P06AnD TaxID=3132208 RepID=UPI00399EFEE9